MTATYLYQRGIPWSGRIFSYPRYMAAKAKFYTDSQKDSRRFRPEGVPDLQPGDWLVEDRMGLYGHDVYVVMRFPANRLEPGEVLGKDRIWDSDRYIEWMRKGHQAPPLFVVEQEKPVGNLKVVDGHRRLRAYTKAGIRPLVMVSPSYPSAAGLDYYGNQMMTAFTIEHAAEIGIKVPKEWRLLLRNPGESLGVRFARMQAENPPQERCFACGRALKTPKLVDTRDGQVVFVGPECYRRIESAGEKGWQPPLGGPRLYPAVRTNPPQRTPYTCGPAVALDVLADHGVRATERAVAAVARSCKRSGTTAGGLVRALRAGGVSARALKPSTVQTGDLVRLWSGDEDHWVRVRYVTIGRTYVTFYDPWTGRSRTITMDTFQAMRRKAKAHRFSVVRA